MVVSEGVKEIWLSSEDTGAYGNFTIFFHLSCCLITSFRLLFKMAQMPPFFNFQITKILIFICQKNPLDVIYIILSYT